MRDTAGASGAAPVRAACPDIAHAAAAALTNRPGRSGAQRGIIDGGRHADRRARGHAHAGAAFGRHRFTYEEMRRRGPGKRAGPSTPPVLQGSLTAAYPRAGEFVSGAGGIRVRAPTRPPGCRPPLARRARTRPRRARLRAPHTSRPCRWPAVQCSTARTAFAMSSSLWRSSCGRCTDMSTTTALTPATRCAACSAATFSATLDGCPDSVTTRSSTSTPMRVESTAGSHASSSSTSCFTCLSVFIARSRMGPPGVSPCRARAAPAPARCGRRGARRCRSAAPPARAGRACRPPAAPHPSARPRASARARRHRSLRAFR